MALLVTFNQVIERVTMARTMNLPDPSILGREQNLCSQVRNRIHRRQNQSSSGLELLRRRFRQIALSPAGAHETEASALLFGPSNSVSRLGSREQIGGADSSRLGSMIGVRTLDS